MLSGAPSPWLRSSNLAQARLRPRRACKEISELSLERKQRAPDLQTEHKIPPPFSTPEKEEFQQSSRGFEKQVSCQLSALRSVVVAPFLPRCHPHFGKDPRGGGRGGENFCKSGRSGTHFKPSLGQLGAAPTSASIATSCRVHGQRHPNSKTATAAAGRNSTGKAQGCVWPGTNPAQGCVRPRASQASFLTAVWRPSFLTARSKPWFAPIIFSGFPPLLGASPLNGASPSLAGSRKMAGEKLDTERLMFYRKTSPPSLRGYHKKERLTMAHLQTPTHTPVRHSHTHRARIKSYLFTQVDLQRSFLGSPILTSPAILPTLQGSFLGTKTAVRKRNPSQQKTELEVLRQAHLFGTRSFPTSMGKHGGEADENPPLPQRKGGVGALTGGPKPQIFETRSEQRTQKHLAAAFAQWHTQLILAKVSSHCRNWDHQAKLELAQPNSAQAAKAGISNVGSCRSGELWVTSGWHLARQLRGLLPAFNGDPAFFRASRPKSHPQLSKNSSLPRLGESLLGLKDKGGEGSTETQEVRCLLLFAHQLLGEEKGGREGGREKGRRNDSEGEGMTWKRRKVAFHQFPTSEQKILNSHWIQYNFSQAEQPNDNGEPRMFQARAEESQPGQPVPRPAGGRRRNCPALHRSKIPSPALSPVIPEALFSKGNAYESPPKSLCNGRADAPKVVPSR
ncbi:hypothetical protein L345_01714, partial [Ophiophagus hannah]